MIDHITFTGADDNVYPLIMEGISQVFPYVEWGVLISKSKAGSPRYPSKEWLKKVCNLNTDIPLSLHLCGQYVRDIAEGDFSELEELIDTLVPNRIQLNGYPEDAPLPFLEDIPIILQVKEFNNTLKEDTHVHELFDLSGGRGIAATVWPIPYGGGYYGYSGGLSPANIKHEVALINAASGYNKVWIDMESGIRDEEDNFSLNKVLQVLLSVKITSGF